MSSGRKKSFAARLIESDDRNAIASIAREYSESGVFCNLEVVAGNNFCKVRDVRMLIAYAIVHCYISYAASKRCMMKSHENQSHHKDDPNSISVSDKYYLKLFRDRYQFVLHSFPDKQAARVLDYYINHPYVYDVYKDVGLSRTEFNIVLARAIMFGVADDEDLVAFKAIALSPNKRTGGTKRFLDTICAYREEICVKLPNEITLIKAQLDSYQDNMIPNESEEYSEEDLLRKLDGLEDELGRAQAEAIEFLENRLPYEDPEL